MNKFLAVLRHRWFDRGDARRLVPNDMAERLARRVAASESRHEGQVLLCVETALPLSYLLRLSRHNGMPALTRQRALHWFGQLGIWDTERNNGVLIYLLLAEHRIEFVADRAINAHVDAAQWQAMVDRLAGELRNGHIEGGLTQALEEVSALLVEHFPAEADTLRPNELSDAVVRV
ncbi:MAG: TPM domain-containing protein [Hydrogenophaga sp.]|nr:TPM domain-containing protein [Hydrogenophaga sp.]